MEFMVTATNERWNGLSQERRTEPTEYASSFGRPTRTFSFGVVFEADDTTRVSAATQLRRVEPARQR